MRAVDPRLVSALAEQLGARRAALAAGAQRVGWKLGLGDRESIGGEIAVGHLTSATLLEAAATYVPAGAADLHADAEIAVELGRDVEPADGPEAAAAAIAAYAVALEIVDLARLDGEPASVVAANVFHRAVAFGPWHPALARDVEAKLAVNGAVRASGTAPDDLGRRVHAAARLLDAVGERLRAGDRLITGSVVQVPVGPGDEVLADAGAVGSVRLSVGALADLLR